MNKSLKHTKITIVLIVLMMLFLCAINITYSYFSATGKVTGSGNLHSLTLTCHYTVNDGEPTSVGATQMQIYPASGVLTRGTAFKLKQNATDTASNIDSIGYTLTGTQAFVRFWIDAYIVKDGEVDESVNYGEYFLVGRLSSSSFTEMQVFSSSLYAKENNTYFVVSARNAGSYDIFDSLKFDESAPNEILGETIRIFVTFEAVQTANQAFKQVFDDERGYLSDWEEV